MFASAMPMLENILQFDRRAVSLVENTLGFLGDCFAITWRAVAEVLLGVMLVCGITWAWHDRNPGQILLLLLVGFALKALIVAGRQRTGILFRGTLAALVRTALLPFALAHVSWFLYHPASRGDMLVAIADWSAVLLFYLLAAGESGLQRRKRSAGWDRIKALFGTGWVVAPAPAEE